MPIKHAFTSAKEDGADATLVRPIDWNAEHVESQLFLDKFREFIPWVSVDGFTVGGDTGYSVLPRGSFLYLHTGATANYGVTIRTLDRWFSFLNTGKVITLEYSIFWPDTVTMQNIWLRLATAWEDPPSETAHHFGWKLIGGAAVMNLWASNADGTTQTITDTGVTMAANMLRTRLKIVFNPGTDCKFYVNDVLKVTHTTNLPTGAHYYLHFHMRTLEAATKYFYIGRVLIEKEHA